MKILIVTPIFPPRTGGPATYVYELAKRLHISHQVTIVCFSSAKPKPIKNVTIIPIKKTGTSISRQFKLLITLLNITPGMDFIYIQGPLVVGFMSSLVATIFAKKRIIKFVGDEVWESQTITTNKYLNPESFYQSFRQFNLWPQIITQRLSLKLVNKIIVPSYYLKKFLTKYHHLNFQKIIVIPNAIKTQLSSIKKKPHKIVVASRLVPWKNIDQIISAVYQARKNKPWKLTIIGEGPNYQQLKKLAQKLKANSWLTFTGRLSHSQTLKHIAQAQKLILYSSYEGQAHTLLEALNSQTHVIASNIPSNQELLQEFGTKVPLKNISLLSQAINQSSAPFKEAQKYVRATFTWKNHLRSFKQLL